MDPSWKEDAADQLLLCLRLIAPIAKLRGNDEKIFSALLFIFCYLAQKCSEAVGTRRLASFVLWILHPFAPDLADLVPVYLAVAPMATWQNLLGSARTIERPGPTEDWSSFGLT